MKPFKRTIEKVLAWISNILLIFGTVMLSVAAFSGTLRTLITSDTFRNQVEYEITQQSGSAVGLPTNYDELASLLEVGFRVYAIIYIIITIIALVATFTMKNRVLSGVLFIVAAIGVALSTLGAAAPIYLLQFITGVMLFVRKEEPDYVNQNPYVNNGQNNYNNEQNSYSNINGTSYKTTKKDNDDIDKIEYL